MSAILSADDLNDFISPGVACIKPVEVSKSQDHAEIEISNNGEAAFEVGLDGEKKELEAAQISLSDCLACSGCITSAESVLVSLQSHQEVLSAIRSVEASQKVFVASVSHQARVSFAVTYDISVEEADARLRHVLVDLLGFKYMVGMEIGRGISLEYSAREALGRPSGAGPLLSSSCPGWTLYVEKTHPHVVDHLSKVKSPQQITGTILKQLISRQHGVAPQDVYHLSIMPCFDKKLEAARPEFGDSVARDVDCVITPREVVQILSEEGLDFNTLPRSQVPDSALCPDQWPYQYQWMSNEGSSSGGFVHKILREVQNQVSVPTTIETIPGRNADMEEYVVINETDKSVLFRAGKVYGFRNIQNLVRKLKPARAGAGKVVSRARAGGRKSGGSDPSQWGYIEVQACPGGCINGGGLIGKPEHVGEKEWRARSEQVYQDQLQVADVGRATVSNWLRAIYPAFNPTESELALTDPLLSVTFKPVEAPAGLDDNPTAAAVSVGTKW